MSDQPGFVNKAKYLELTAEVLRKHQLGGADALLSAVLDALRSAHLARAGADPGNPRLTSLVDCFMEVVAAADDAHARSAKADARSAKADHAASPPAEVAQLAALRDLLSQLLAVWNFERMDHEGSPGTEGKGTGFPR